MVLSTLQDIMPIKKSRDSLILCRNKFQDHPLKELRVRLERLEMTPDLQQQIIPFIKQEITSDNEDESTKREVSTSVSAQEGGATSLASKNGGNQSNQVPTSILKRKSCSSQKKQVTFCITTESDDGCEQYLNDINFDVTEEEEKEIVVENIEHTSGLKSILKSSNKRTTLTERKLSFCATTKSNIGCISFLNDTIEHSILQNQLKRLSRKRNRVEEFSIDSEVADDDFEENDSSISIQKNHVIEDHRNSLKLEIEINSPRSEPSNEEDDSFLSFNIDHDPPLVSSPIEDPLDDKYLESCMEPKLVTIHVNGEESSILHSLITDLEKKQQCLEKALENSIEIDNCDDEISNVLEEIVENRMQENSSGQSSNVTVENSDEIMIEFEKVEKKVQNKRQIDMKRHREVMKKHLEWIRKSRKEYLAGTSKQKDCQEVIIDCNSDSDIEPLSKKKKCDQNVKNQVDIHKNTDITESKKIQPESSVNHEKSTVSNNNTTSNDDLQSSEKKLKTSKIVPTISSNNTTSNDDLQSSEKTSKIVPKITTDDEEIVENSDKTLPKQTEKVKSKRRSKILPKRSCRKKKIHVDSESSEDFEGSEDEYTPEQDKDLLRKRTWKQKSSNWKDSSDEDDCFDEFLETSETRQGSKSGWKGKTRSSENQISSSADNAGWNGKTRSSENQKSSSAYKDPPADTETTEEGQKEEKMDKNCRRCQIVKNYNLQGYLHYVYSCDMEQLLKTVNDIKFLKKPFISQASMWECFNCKETFLVESDVIKHYKKVHRKHITSCDAAKLLVYKCKFCLRTFWCEEDLDVHIDTKHPENYVCSYCSKGFTDKNSFRCHIKLHVKLNTTLNSKNCEDKPPKCPDCGKDHSGESEELVGGFDYVCCYCANQFETSHHLQRHLNVQHLKPFLCHYCDKRFGSVRYLRYHINSHVGVEKSTCEKCRKSFWSVKQLQRHIKNHFRSASVLHCQFCNTTAFKLKENFRKHVTNSHGYLSPILFKTCKLCGLTLKKCKDFTEHCDVMHANMYLKK